LPDETVQKIVELRRAGKNNTEIAAELGLNRGTVTKYLKTYLDDKEVSDAGPPGAPGEIRNKLDVDGSVELTTYEEPPSVDEMMRVCKIDKTKWIPKYFRGNVWQGFYKVKDGTGHRKVQLVQSRATFQRIIPEGIEQAIIEFVRSHVPPAPLPSRVSRAVLKKDEDGFLVVAGIWDAHIGLYSWRDETGYDYDVNIATNRILNAIDDITTELSSWPIARMILPIGNDFMHFDSVRGKTAHGEHFLDVDTRYAKVYSAALKCLVRQVERALELCGDVYILYTPGNHDFSASYGLCVALSCWFRDDKRVVVDLSANQRKHITWGGVLLGFEHGADMKPERLAHVFSTDCQAEWSASTYREVQIGHRHQNHQWEFEGVIPTSGVTIRMNPALTNSDHWHTKQGFISAPQKAIEAWRYDKIAYRGSHCVWVRDDSRDSKAKKTYS
jgi:hypothetical protein